MFAGRSELDDRLRLGDIVERQLLLAEKTLGLLVDPDPRKDLLVSQPAAGIGVRDLHELPDGVLTIAHDVRRDPLGDGDHPPTDHQRR
jgi:hypothetical protein